jgi:hypothetical protein
MRIRGEHQSWKSWTVRFFIVYGLLMVSLLIFDLIR